MIALDHASVLVACRDQRNIIRIAHEKTIWPGIHRQVDGSRPIVPQVRKIWAEYIAQPDFAQKVLLLGAVEPLLRFEQQVTSCLFVLAMQQEDFQAPEDWLTLPELLRSLPSGRNRVAYNKAFQILAGALSDEFHALEVDEAVQKRLTELIKRDY